MVSWVWLGLLAGHNTTTFSVLPLDGVLASLAPWSSPNCFLRTHGSGLECKARPEMSLPCADMNMFDVPVGFKGNRFH